MVSKRKGVGRRSDMGNGRKRKAGVVKPQKKGKDGGVEIGADIVRSSNNIPREKHLKIWDLYYEERHRNFTSKVKYWSDMEVSRIIMTKLTKEQLEVLKMTCFGNFLDVGEPQFFPQIIQHVLVREFYKRDQKEMWFLFGEKKVRFVLPDFCLISGLSWQGNEDISAFDGRENPFVKKFFQDEVVTHFDIKRRYQSVVFDDDE